MKEEDRRKRLVRLGPEALVDALLELAGSSDVAEGVVERLASTPDENLKRVKSRLAGLRRTRRFVEWRGVPELAGQLRGILSDLEAADPNPKTGVELMAAFYRCDDPVFGRCDDSSGMVGDVFEYQARDLFIRYAAACEDKEWVGNVVVELCLPSQWHARSVLVDSAADFLPDEEMRRMVDILMKRWEEQSAESRLDSNEGFLIMSLAKQLRDAPLFERVVTATWPELHGSTCIDIARVYLESGNAGKAHECLERFPSRDFHRARDRDELLLAVLERLGDGEGVKETAWRLFRRERSADALDKLLLVIGEGERERVVEQETANIRESERFSYSDALFLVRVGRPEKSEDYLLRHQRSIDGDVYFALLPIAKGLEEAGCPLGASVVYRALLESILARAQSKYYHHGVRYLKKLDGLAHGVTDWKGIAGHEDYKEGLLTEHSRKRSFWSRYEKGD